MKFGDQLEQESVPEWSLHNIDYNALKHEIKVHTTRDQATAIAIPGHKDAALQKFEDRLYLELCRQHDRVDLFVSSKADEISRRLDALSSQIKRLIAKCDREGKIGLSLKRQRRFSKYERDVLRCEEDILALSRFINAQIEAFRKINKKYKKWTGSPALAARFRENVLSNPSSFTRRDFVSLQNDYEELLSYLRQSSPQFSEPSSPSSFEPPSPLGSRNRSLNGSREGDRAGSTAPRTRFLEPTIRPSEMNNQGRGYWNEYDYPSDGEGGGAGGGRSRDEYAIYVDPDADDSFPGLKPMLAIIKRPLQLANSWFGRQRNDSDPTRQSLLVPRRDAETSDAGVPANGYGGISPFARAHETDEEAGYASSEDSNGVPPYMFRGGPFYFSRQQQEYQHQQHTERVRDGFLSWATIASFVASFALLLLSGTLVATGRHKLRVEVDAGVTVGTVGSFFCAGLGLGTMLYRTEKMGMLHRVAVWTCFLTSCVLNLMLLVVVVGNSG